MFSDILPKSAGFAGQNGDGWMIVESEQPDVYSKIMGNWFDAASRVGKKPATLRRMIERISLAPMKAAAFESLRKSCS